PPRPARRLGKREVESLVARGDHPALEAAAEADPLVLRRIQRLLYSPDPERRWGAVIALGRAAAAAARRHPSAVGDLLRQLIYAAADSAAAGWGTLEAAGEIIRHAPDPYGSFVRNLLAFLRDPPARAAVLWAVGRIGEVHPDIVKRHPYFPILDLLADPAPEIRGHAAWALGRLRAREAGGPLGRLAGDEAAFSLFDGHRLRRVSVGEVARAALRRIQHPAKTAEAHMKPEETAPLSPEDEAALAEALRLYREADIERNQGGSLDAMEKYRQALEVFERLGRAAEAANACEKLGDLHIQRGDFNGALPLYQRALAVCEKKGDPLSFYLLAEKIVDVYRHRQQMEKALPYLFRMLEIAESAGDAGRAGLCLTGIGDVYQRQDEPEKALEAYRLASRIYREMGSKKQAAILDEGIVRLERLCSGAADPGSQP
ncbi:DVU0298 family protein, partial [Dissulfurirhabdus thermomarina]